MHAFHLAAGAAVSLAAVFCTATLADNQAPGVRHDGRDTLTLTWENDKFTGTDRNYTNGLRIAWFEGAPNTDGITIGLARTLLGAGDDTVVRRQFAFGQSIFTPEDIEAVEPLPNQHPYAGWLYGEYAIVAQRRDTIERLSVQIGMVGPSAGGEWAQNEIHRAVGVDRARGWDNQIDDEPGIIIGYERKARTFFKRRLGKFSMDIIPSIGGSIGNVETTLRVGGIVRYGQDLRNDYGPPRVRPALAGNGFFAPRDHASWYVFAGVDARAVAHNIFLEGSLFRDGDPSVTPKRLVGDFQFGAVAQFRAVQLALTLVARTDEFDEQRQAQRFGALSISTKF